MVLAVLILVSIVSVIIIHKAIKPYFIRYDKDIVIAGPPGAGKTCTGAKLSTKLIRIAKFWWGWTHKVVNKFKNWRIRRHNKREEKRFKKKENYITHLKSEIQPIPKPQVYSSIPLNIKLHWWPWSKREWSCKLKISHLLCLEEMTQNNIVLFDEMPNAINQYNWDIPEIQDLFSEYASMHRHYYNNINIITAQAPSNVVIQYRRMVNKTTLMLFFHKLPILPIFRASCMDIMTNELVSTMASTQIDEATRTYWGLMPPKGTYDSRCYSNRIKNILIPLQKGKAIERWDNLKTNDIMRFDTEKLTVLDDTTTKQQKESVLNKYRQQLEANKIEQLAKPPMTLDILSEIVAEELHITAEEAKQRIIDRKKDWDKRRLNYDQK